MVVDAQPNGQTAEPVVADEAGQSHGTTTDPVVADEAGQSHGTTTDPVVADEARFDMAPTCLRCP